MTAAMTACSSICSPGFATTTAVTGVEVPEVAGVEPAVPEGLVGRLLVLEACRRGLGPAVDDLTGLVLGQQRAVVGHDRDVHVRRRGAGSAVVGELVLGPEDRRRGALLGLPEEQVEAAAEDLEALAERRSRHRRHRVEGAPEGGKVGRRAVGVVEEHAIHDRDPEDLGDPLGLDQMEEAGRVEAGLDVQWQLSWAVWNIGIIATNRSSASNRPSSSAIISDSTWIAVWLPTTPFGEGHGAARAEVGESCPVVDQHLRLGVGAGREDVGEGCDGEARRTPEKGAGRRRVPTTVISAMEVTVVVAGTIRSARASLTTSPRAPECSRT